jgi:hypothetical protein
MKGWYDLILFLLAIAALYITFSRWWKNAQANNFGDQLLQQLNTNPHFAKVIAQELQNLYGSESNAGMQSLQTLLLDFTEGKRYGKFEILRKIELPSGEFLFVTICHATDYDIVTHKKFREVAKVYQLSFVVKNNLERQKIEVYSDYYELLPDKFLRQEFATEIFKLRTPQ